MSQLAIVGNGSEGEPAIITCPIKRMPSPLNQTPSQGRVSPTPSSTTSSSPAQSKPAKAPAFTARKFSSGPGGVAYSSTMKALESQIDDDLAKELDQALAPILQFPALGLM